MKFSISTIKSALKGVKDKAAWGVKKKSPQILCAVGVVSTIAGVVVACKETPKALEKVQEHKDNIAIVQEAKEAGVTKAGKEYSAQDAKVDTIKITGTTCISLVKAYAPAAALIACGIGSFIWSNAILTNRLNLVMGAYTALSVKFNDYRARVRERLGSEEERNICHGVKAIDMAEKTLDENGNEVTNVKQLKVADDDDYSDVFTRYNFDGSVNSCWDPDIEQNLTFLRIKERHWTDQLFIRNGSPVFLNEVRADLGLPRTQTGNVVGWVWKPDDKKHIGDNIVKFGIDDIVTAYRNGEEIPDEQGIVLDFNVDGNVLYNL